VARLTQASSNAKAVPPLYDVALLSSSGEVWTLTGHERIRGGPLQQEHAMVQSWLVTPAPLEDLRKAELEWARLSELVASLKQGAGE
jgi:hypothetical protein